ncbi:hypothetical protein [Anoxybacterium hadale]
MDRKTGEIEEVYNGPGDIPFEKAYHYQKLIREVNGEVKIKSPVGCIWML